MRIKNFLKSLPDHLQSPHFRGKLQYLEITEQPCRFSLRAVCYGPKYLSLPAPPHLSHPCLWLSQARHSLLTGTPALLSELELQGTNAHRGLLSENNLSSKLAPLYFGNSQRGLFFLAFKCPLNNTPALFFIYMQVYQLNYGFPADCQS